VAEEIAELDAIGELDQFLLALMQIVCYSSCLSNLLSVSYCMHPTLIAEAKQLRQKALDTKDFRSVYYEYLNSGHWKALKSDMAKFRGKKCEFCGAEKSLNLHHLQYKNWYDVEPEDLIWLCKLHHDIIHNFGRPEGDIPSFLARDTIKLLSDHERKGLQEKLQQLMSSNASLSSKNNTKPRVEYLQDPSLTKRLKQLEGLNVRLTSDLKKSSRSVPMWLTVLAIATSLGVGGFVGVIVEQPVKEAIKSILPSTHLD
jgi:hypothetical protein